jgi:hypothetical protein
MFLGLAHWPSGCSLGLVDRVPEKLLRWYLHSDVVHSNSWLGVKQDEAGRCRAKYQDLSVYAYLGMESWPLFTLNFYPVIESFTIHQHHQVDIVNLCMDTFVSIRNPVNCYYL